LDQDDSRIPENIRYSFEEERIIVVGAGGIGAWFVINVVLSSNMYGTTLMVCDGDTLEETNLGRLPYPLSWVGKNKALALREFVCGFMERTDRTIVDFQSHLDISMLEELNPTLVVDCCDNQIVQEQIKDHVRKVRALNTPIRYIRLAGDSGYITVTSSDEESYAGIGASNNGYLVVPSWAGNVMLPAIFGFHALVKHCAVGINHKDIYEYLETKTTPVVEPLLSAAEDDVEEEEIEDDGCIVTYEAVQIQGDS